MEKTYGFKDLIVWQKSYQLTKEVYGLTLKFPRQETYGLVQQMRRACLSIPSNIAEGYGRQSKKEYRQFLSIAYGSLCEIETQYLISIDLNYVSPNKAIEQLILEVGRMLYRMIHPLSPNSYFLSPLCNKRGSLLITALWAVSIFSVMTAGLTFHASQEILLMKRELEDLETHTDFISGLNEMARLIHEDAEPHEDSTAKPWFGELKLDEPLQERLKIHGEDEPSKVNLNEATVTFLNIFFKMFEDEISPLKGSRKDYVKEIVKLRSEKRMESLEELLLIEGFKPEDYKLLYPYLTVYPESPLVNLNTAGPLVIRALIESLAGDHGAKQILLSCLEEASAHSFLSLELNPEIFRSRLKLPNSPLMMQLVEEFVTAVTTDSDVFRVHMKSTKTGDEASAIFQYRVGQLRPVVLSWREE